MKPLWNRQQFPVPCDEAPAVDRRRADEVPLQTQPAAEVDSPGFFGNEGIRPPFQQKPLLPYGMDEAPQATACFEQVQADGLVQSGSSVQDAVSSGQPGNSTTNHNQPVRRFQTGVHGRFDDLWGGMWEPMRPSDQHYRSRLIGLSNLFTGPQTVVGHRIREGAGASAEEGEQLSKCSPCGPRADSLTLS